MTSDPLSLVSSTRVGTIPVAITEITVDPLFPFQLLDSIVSCPEILRFLANPCYCMTDFSSGSPLFLPLLRFFSYRRQPGSPTSFVIAQRVNNRALGAIIIDYKGSGRRTHLFLHALPRIVLPDEDLGYRLTALAVLSK